MASIGNSEQGTGSSELDTAIEEMWASSVTQIIEIDPGIVEQST